MITSPPSGWIKAWGKYQKLCHWSLKRYAKSPAIYDRIELAALERFKNQFPYQSSF